MARKSKETLLKEYTKARQKLLRFVNEFTRCHPSSKRYPELQDKVVQAEEECIFLNRKIHKWKPGDPDKLI